MEAAWNRFLNAPQPVGYDPAMIPGWTDPDAPAFGVLRLTGPPCEFRTWLRVLPGSMLTQGEGTVLSWRA